METIWRNCIFGLRGVKDFHRRMFGVIVTSTEAQRKAWLDEVRGTVDSLFPRGLEKSPKYKNIEARTSLDDDACMQP